MRRALICAALLPGPAAAADLDGPDVLPPWVVVESRLRPDLAAVRASAWLAADTWSDRSVVTLADAFRHIPGAVMQESFGGFEPPRLSIRGSGVQSAPSSRGLALRLDELPLGLADGSFNAALFDPLLGATLEIQRGLDGWRATPATMGGALDVRSAGALAPAESALRFEAGSFGARRVRGSAGTTRGRTRATAAFGIAGQNGFRDHSRQARTTALASVDRSFGDDTHAGLGVYHAHARYDVPGPLTLAMAWLSPRSVSTGVDRDRPNRTSELTRLAGRVARRNPATEFDVGFAFARTADDFQQLQANGITRSRSDDASLHAAFAQRFLTANIPHQARVVADVTRGWRELRRFRNDAGQRGPEFARDRLYPTTATFQLEDAFALTRTLVGTVGGARATARRDRASRSAPEFHSRWRFARTLTQASVRWNVAPEAAVFASVSSVAEPPTYDDMLVVGGQYPSLERQMNPLAAQRATTVEMGMRGRTGALAWDAAVYDAAWKNEILRLTDAGGVSRGAVNAGRTRHRGIEAAARWLVLDRPIRVALLASATWGEFRFEDDPVHGNGRLAGLPPHLGYADVVAEFQAGYFAAGGADWTRGRTLVDHAGRLNYGGRTVAHVRFGRRWGEWTGFVEVRNLFDRGGIASTAGVLDRVRNPAATSIFLPAAGRTFNVGLEWKR